MDKKKLIKTIAICEGAGIAGSMFTAPAIPGWYAGLVKPVFSPPNWVFGPVWTGLFLLMGIALYRAEIKKADRKWFWIQLGLNVGWSVLFFGLKNPGAAAGEILLLWAAICVTIIKFRQKDKTAAYLLYPYLAWVSFASVLNFSVWLLNY